MNAAQVTVLSSILVGLLALIEPTTARGAGSGSQEPATDPYIEQYNKGVDLMLKKKFEKAEKWFRRALQSEPDFAEAHNNLAYVLRKQGSGRFDEALGHYDRAIELAPSLPQPYMYRGVLHVQMGHVPLAKKDHEVLTGLDPTLAGELQYVIENGREKEPEQFFGVSQRRQ